MNAVPLSTFLEAINGQTDSEANLPTHISKISIDTRRLQPSEVYWAIRGSNHDGHNFVQDAIEKGASACIVNHDDRIAANPARPLIHVPDTSTALQNLAKWHRAQFDIQAIGVTGSYGKTTTRELIYRVLQTRHQGLRNQHNYNNEIGVPLTLLDIEQHHQFLIVEMGAGKPGDIAPLAEITSPQIGIITGVGPAHIAGFQNVEQIVQTKGDLFAGLPEDGLAILPGDSPWRSQLEERAQCRTITVGRGPGNTYQATHIESSNPAVCFQVHNHCFQLPVAGRHFVTAALFAIAVGTELGYTPEEIQQGFAEFQPVAGRCQVEQFRPWTIINDTYNANPDSCRAACEMLAAWNTAGRRFFVLGDMLELGGESAGHHEQLGELAASLQIDFLYVLGRYAEQVHLGASRTKPSKTTVLKFEKHDEILETLQDQLNTGDVVLIKGSRGMQMERVAEGLKTQNTKRETKIETAA